MRSHLLTCAFPVGLSRYRNGSSSSSSSCRWRVMGKVCSSVTTRIVTHTASVVSSSSQCSYHMEMRHFSSSTGTSSTSSSNDNRTTSVSLGKEGAVRFQSVSSSPQFLANAPTAQLATFLEQEVLPLVSQHRKAAAEAQRLHIRDQQRALHFVWCGWALMGVVYGLLFVGTYYVFSWSVTEPLTYAWGCVMVWATLLWCRRYLGESISSWLSCWRVLTPRRRHGASSGSSAAGALQEHRTLPVLERRVRTIEAILASRAGRGGVERG